MKRKITILVAIFSLGLQLCNAQDNECEKITTLPYTEDFNSCGVQSSEAIPNCWTRAASHLVMWEYPSCVTNYSSVTGNFLCFLAYDGDTNIISAPELSEDIDITKIKVSFLYESSQVGMEFVVGVMSDPREAETFIPVDTVKATSSLVWKQMSVTFENYEGEGRYIAFYLGKPYTSNQYASVFIDNFTIELAVSEEPCSVKPTKLKVSQITTDNAVITWKENTPVETWMVFYKKVSDAEFDSIQVWDNPYYDFEGNLEESMAYQVFVKSDCGDYNPLSSDTVIFNTLCNAITTLPYEDNFDNYSEGTFPQCWYSASKYTSSWDNDAPNVEYKNNAPTSNNVLTFRADNSSKSVAVMNALSDEINIQNVKLSFKYYASSFGQNIIVGVMEDKTDLGSFVAIDTIESLTNSWEDKEVYFNNYEGEGKFIAFWFGVPYNYSWSQLSYIDNVKLESFDAQEPCAFAPKNIMVSDITTNSVTVSWQDEYYSGTWYVYYKNSSSQKYDSVEVNDTTYTFEEGMLESATLYDIYVKSYCSEDKLSPASSLLYFRTACDGINSLPYYENFESSSYDTIPSCWASINYQFLVDMTYPRILVNGYNMSNWLAFMTDTDEINVAVCPRLDESLGDINQMKVTFKYNDYFSNGVLAVGVMTNPSDKETFELIQTVENYNSWDDISISFSQYTGEGRYIAFYAGTPYDDNSGIFVGIDELTIEYDTSTTCVDTYDTLTVEICSDTPYLWKEKYLSQSGTYQDTVLTNDGCKQINVLILKVNDVVNEILEETICDNTSYTFADEILTKTGIYTKKFTSFSNCDSIVELHLTVLPTYTEQITAEITQGESYTLNNKSYTMAGTYYDTLTASNGCDSVITLILSVKSGIEEINNNNGIIIYPNPAKDYITIENIECSTEHITINIYDTQGKLVLSEIKPMATTYTLNTTSLHSGVYYVNILSNNQTISHKLIIK
ncbi:MAG: T9SS type A sorting domain-containing protein [Bacteroidales bacterium]|nr:T9SS type A sorting domain-containing protein [Bacteroidales bacterium]